MSLKEAADGRRGLATELAAARAALEAAQARIRELEAERGEIRVLLEKFLSERPRDTMAGPATPGMPAELARLLASAGREEVARGASGSGASPSGAPESPSEVGGTGAVPPPTHAAEPGRRRLEPPASREDLLSVLRSGARIETNESFHRFQPVQTSHIEVSDWLARAHDYAALESLAAGQVSDEELLAVVHLFFQKAFIRIESD